MPELNYFEPIVFLKIGGEYAMNIENPVSLNEKLQWLQKYVMKGNSKYDIRYKLPGKEYVGKVLGEEYVAKVFDIYTSPDDINWDTLPNHFVIKREFGGGGEGVIVVRDKNSMDKITTINQIRDWIANPQTGLDWLIRHDINRVFVEEYIEGAGGENLDYKVYCFNGRARLLLVSYKSSTNNAMSSTGSLFSFYTIQGNGGGWIQAPFTRPGHGLCDSPLPKKLTQMVELSEKIASEGFPFMRVDWYESGDRIIVGELTPYSACGFALFDPLEWDYTLGSWLTLPSKQVK
ncbi:glycosyl transferase [Spirochaetia bacterium]|nr:glycosyl transferase [Spirochaetia bacterium]